MQKLFLLLFILQSVVGFSQIDEILAKQYFQDGEYTKALLIFEDLYKEEKSDKIYKPLLETYIQLEDYRGGLKLISKHQKSKKHFTTIYDIDEYWVLGLLEDVKGQAKIRESILNDINKNPGLAYQTSKQASDLGLFSLSLNILEMAESTDPRMTFHFQKATLYAELGEIEKMYGSYLELVNQSPSYVRYVQSLIQRNIEQNGSNANNEQIKRMLIKKVQEGQNIVYNDLLIWVLTQEGDYYGALAQLKALDRRLNRNQAEIFEFGVLCQQNQAWKIAYEAFDFIIEKGNQSLFFTDARLEKAFTALQELSESKTTSKTAYEDLYNNFSALLLAIGETDEAVVLMQKMAAIKAYQLKDIAAAEALLLRAIEIPGANEQEVARCKLELGDILLLNGDYYDAILYYAQVEKGLPDSPIGQEAKYRKARVAYFQGDFEWALAQFNVLKQATSKLISNDAIRMSLLISDHTALDTTTTALELYAAADLLAYRKMFEKSTAQLDFLMATLPEHKIGDYAKALKAKNFAALNNYESAAQNYLELIEHYPKSILLDRARFDLAVLFESQLGDKEKAMEYYQNVFEYHPESILAAEARNRFRQLRGDFVN